MKFLLPFQVGYEIHTTKCVCEDGIPCRTNCSNNGFGDPKICATLYSEPNCWDCRHVGISVEFDSSLVLHGSDLVKVAQFQSFRLRHGCTMQILYLDENANILEQMEDKYPWSTDWKVGRYGHKFKLNLYLLFNLHLYNVNSCKSS